MFRVRTVCLYLAAAVSALAQTGWRGSPILDEIVEQAINQNEIPGAVLVVGHKGKVLHRKAYGSRSLEPSREPMTVDTIFDCASLTKVVATTSSIMLLVEEGKVRLNDRAAQYLPGFAGGDITVRQLMTHFSGLRPDLDLNPPWSGY
ncbi:MAG TPA: serine hydrolase domain-containing protein, partial [Bryobacterales bacterium]|nr:serine hydrolase domain-containing protein [Bryobacterales bacterium]